MSGVSPIYFDDGVCRVPLRSMWPAIRLVKRSKLVFDLAQVAPEKLVDTRCDWNGHAIAKGVTHVGRALTCFGVTEQIVRGFHYRLCEGFGVPLDSLPVSYEDQLMERGFGGFTRWVYFASLGNEADVIGVDYNQAPPLQSGIATSVWRVMQVLIVLARQGVPLGHRVALINQHLLWVNGIAAMQERSGLLTVGDFVNRAPQLLWPVGPLCPRCGLSTFWSSSRNFCTACGAKPAQVRQLTKGGPQCTSYLPTADQLIAATG